MPEATFDHQRALLSASLAAVADSMRNCAQIAETFAKIVDDSSDFQGVAQLLSDTLKGKGKALHADDDAPKKRKRNTKPKDPNAPKRPASSYILFQNEVRKELKEQHPTLSNADLLNLISEQWKSMSDEQKETYNQAMKTAKALYSEQKSAYDNRTPEEIEAANRAAAAALLQKKAQAKQRGPKAKHAVAAAEAPPKAAASEGEASHSSEVSDDDDSDDDDAAAAPAKAAIAPDSESSDEDEDDEPPVEEPLPKKRRGAAPQDKGKKGRA